MRHRLCQAWRSSFKQTPLKPYTLKKPQSLNPKPLKGQQQEQEGGEGGEMRREGEGQEEGVVWRGRGVGWSVLSLTSHPLSVHVRTWPPLTQQLQLRGCAVREASAYATLSHLEVTHR